MNNSAEECSGVFFQININQISTSTCEKNFIFFCLIPSNGDCDLVGGVNSLRPNKVQEEL